MIFWLFFFGYSNPEFLIAELTLLFASSTDLSGSPTILKQKRPRDMSVSTVTISASMPERAEENALEDIISRKSEVRNIKTICIYKYREANIHKYQILIVSIFGFRIFNT